MTRILEKNCSRINCEALEVHAALNLQRPVKTLERFALFIYRLARDFTGLEKQLGDAGQGREHPLQVIGFVGSNHDE